MTARFPPILCTLGTTTDDRRVLAAMRRAGMGMARVNTAYASLEELRERIDLLRAAAPVPLLLDLKGPQLRVDCTTDKVDPDTGRTVTVPCRYPIAPGDLICVGFQTGPVRFNHDFQGDLEVGDEVTFQNGTIRTRVADPDAEDVDVPPRTVLLRVLDAGEGKMTPQMGANVPGKHLHVPLLTERDLAAVGLGLELAAEWYALSFVRRPEEVENLDRVLRDGGDAAAGLVLKIEEAGGVANLEVIVAAARACERPVAVMIARGDLFVELPRVRLAAVQADLIARCSALGVPAIVATGLLLSMQRAPSPARSEVCDVAAALQQGAEALLLSDETSNSEHPVEAVRVLAELIRTYRPALAAALAPGGHDDD